MPKFAADFTFKELFMNKNPISSKGILLPKGKITAHFTWEEMLHSATLDRYNKKNGTSYCNYPDAAQRANLAFLCERLEHIRERWGQPLRIGSAFRCNFVNTLVGGSATSHHLTGLAADLSGRDLEECFMLTKLALEDPYSVEVLLSVKTCGKLKIWWVHVAFATTPKKEKKFGIDLNGHVLSLKTSY
jgi:hypothetical protein